MLTDSGLLKLKILGNEFATRIHNIMTTAPKPYHLLGLAELLISQKSYDLAASN